jgi:hypothetical protein
VAAGRGDGTPDRGEQDEGGDGDEALRDAGQSWDTEPRGDALLHGKAPSSMTGKINHGGQGVIVYLAVSTPAGVSF